VQGYFLKDCGKDGQTYWSYSLILIIQWLVFASAFCLCTKRPCHSAGRCKRALGFPAVSILFHFIVVWSQQGLSIYFSFLDLTKIYKAFIC